VDNVQLAQRPPTQRVPTDEPGLARTRIKFLTSESVEPDQVRDAIRQRPRLAAPRARDDEDRPWFRRDRRELLVVELRPVIDLRTGRRVAFLQDILDRHPPSFARRCGRGN